MYGNKCQDMYGEFVEYGELQSYANYETYVGSPILTYLNKEANLGVVMTSDREEVTVNIPDWMLEGIELYDFVEFEGDFISGEFIVTDYFVNEEALDASEGGYIEDYREMIGL